MKYDRKMGVRGLKFLFALSLNFPFTLSSSFLFFRKDQNFMRLLNNVKLEDLINKTASTVQRELSQVTPDCTGTELFTIKEDVSPKINVLLYSSPWPGRNRCQSVNSHVHRCLHR